MTEILEAKQELDAVRAEAKAAVDRQRAKLGLTMIRARERRQESQTTIAAGLEIGPQQVREYERAYKAWADKHQGETLD